MKRNFFRLFPILIVLSGEARADLLEHRLEFPDGEGPFPTVILLHTSGGYESTFDHIQRYKDLGYGVAHPNYYSTFGIDKENRFTGFKEKRKDIEKALVEFVNFIKTNPKVDSDNLFTVGFSAGGFYSAFLACKDLVSAGSAHYGVWSFPGSRNKFTNFGPKQYPAQYFDKDCSPFLALHGDNDRIQKMRYVDLAFKYIKKTSNDFRVHMYENVGHRWDRWSLYTDPSSPGSDSLKRTHEFFQNFLR
jgi:dienelactone hydrolase